MKKLYSVRVSFLEHASCADDEARSFVNALRREVVNRSVGGHVNAALCTSPVVGGAEKGTADAATSVGFRDEPAFQITDGQPFLAAVGS